LSLNISIILVTVITALLFAVIGLLYTLKTKTTAGNYIIARNKVGGLLATATLVASGLGAWILFSPAETGASSGIVGLIGYSIGSAAPLLAFIFLGSRLRRLMPEGHSLTEFVKLRYGSAAHILTLVVMVFYMFVFLAAELTGISLAVNLLGGTPLVITASIVGIFTMIYTAFGGIRVSIFTDSIQFVFIIPLIAAVFLILLVALGGFGSAFSTVNLENRDLLSLTHWPGIEFGLTLIIAISAAEMFNGAYWQRVYSCKDERSLKTGFLSAGLLVIPVIFLMGLLGVVATGNSNLVEPSSALFELLINVVPSWVFGIVLVLAVILVMSSMDSLLNGISSVFTADLAQLIPNLAGSKLLLLSRLATAALIIPLIVIASNGYSVLYLFLIADLVCAATVFPIFYGLFSPRVGQKTILISCAIGIIIGALFFPNSSYEGWNSIPYSGRFLVSFGAAVGISAVVCLITDTYMKFTLKNPARFSTFSVKPID
jgi:Na+/proline symporter